MKKIKFIGNIPIAFILLSFAGVFLVSESANRMLLFITSAYFLYLVISINKIVVTTEDNRALEITVLLVFELPEFNKKYVLYYLENDNADENVTMFISEFNPITNEIKEIDKDEIDIIKNVYLEIKKDALKEDNI